MHHRPLTELVEAAATFVTQKTDPPPALMTEIVVSFAHLLELHVAA